MRLARIYIFRWRAGTRFCNQKEFLLFSINSRTSGQAQIARLTNILDTQGPFHSWKQ